MAASFPRKVKQSAADSSEPAAMSEMETLLADQSVGGDSDREDCYDEV